MKIRPSIFLVVTCKQTDTEKLTGEVLELLVVNALKNSLTELAVFGALTLHQWR